MRNLLIGLLISLSVYSSAEENIASKDKSIIVKEESPDVPADNETKERKEYFSISGTFSESNSFDLQEEIIGSPLKPERRKIRIEQPGIGISPNTVLKGVADVMVDGQIESDSMAKENFVDVLIDDSLEKTDESIEALKEKPNQIKLPK